LLPPRFLPSSFGFVDTLNVIGGIGSWDSALMKDAGNLYAAMPSLHIAWALWCVFALVPVVRRRWIKALLILHPFVTLFSIIVTANHYFLDAAGGVVVFCLGLAIARLPRPAFTIAPLATLRGVVPQPAWLPPATASLKATVEATRARLASVAHGLPSVLPSARRRRPVPGSHAGAAPPVAAAGAPSAASPSDPPDGDGRPAEVGVGA
jgi:hypothetical protein